MDIALIGDIHSQWDAHDNAALASMGFAGALFTGDFPGRLHRDLLTVASQVSNCPVPALAIAGNHDGPGPIDILREALSWGPRTARAGQRICARLADLRASLAPVELGGYSLHQMGDIEVLVARPLAMDRRHLSFASALEREFGIQTMEQSRERLCQLIDQTTGPYLVLSHNGPHGFGAQRGAPYALSTAGRDNGDTDLADAIQYALATQQTPLAVVSGHMHHNARKPRQWQVHQGGVLYLNAARVPRRDRNDERSLLRLTVSRDSASARWETYRP